MENSWEILFVAGASEVGRHLVRSKGMPVKRIFSQGLPVARVRGPLRGPTWQMLLAELKAMLEEGHGALGVDLSAVTQMGHGAAGFLLEVRDRLAVSGRKLTLTGLSPAAIEALARARRLPCRTA